MVGWDGSSLEDRVRAHYCFPYDKDGTYTSNLLDPTYSVHDENMKNWKGVTRSLCKNGQYALQYGCMPARFSSTLGVDKKTGDLYYEDWWKRNEPLGRLKADVTKKWKKNGYLLSLDGVRMKCRSEHSLLNTLFQSAGAILMKEAMCLMDKWIDEKGIDSYQVIHYHDEEQHSTDPLWGDVVGNLGCKSIVQAGLNFNLNVPLAAEYEVGSNWAETH
jgi:DNA polymerase I-like protein with 3'-5' exonuclease and polymerase domains